MTLAVFLLLLITFSFTINVLTAIECRFRFVEDDLSQFNINRMKTINQNVIQLNQLSNSEPFECEEPETGVDVQSRFNYDHFRPEEDDYESAVVCETRNRTIYPKGLNNIKNEWIKVVNNNNYIQAIETEECVHQNQQCSEFSTSKCVQQYVKVYLKAFDEKTQKEYNDKFYFPSTCACAAFPEKFSSEKDKNSTTP